MTQEEAILVSLTQQLQAAVTSLQYDIGLLKQVTSQILSNTQATDNQLRPVAPISPTLTPAPGQITIAWNAVNGAETYTIYWGSSPNAQGNVIRMVTNTYVLTGLSTGQQYWVYMTAVNRAGESAPSPISTATPT